MKRLFKTTAATSDDDMQTSVGDSHNKEQFQKKIEDGHGSVIMFTNYGVSVT